MKWFFFIFLRQRELRHHPFHPYFDATDPTGSWVIRAQSWAVWKCQIWTPLSEKNLNESSIFLNQKGPFLIYSRENSADRGNYNFRSNLSGGFWVIYFWKMHFWYHKKDFRKIFVNIDARNNIQLINFRISCDYFLEDSFIYLKFRLK